MRPNPLSAKAQIHAHAHSRDFAETLTLSTEDLAQVSEALQDELRIRWIPPVTHRTPGPGIAVETTLLITIASSAVSLFAAGFMQEAGKDAWNAVKGLVSKVWAKQSEQAYNSSGRAYLLIKQGNESVAIDFTSYRSPQSTREEHFSRVLERQLMCLEEHWESVKSEIERLSHEKRSPVYRVGCRDSMVIVTPLPSLKYLNL